MIAWMSVCLNRHLDDATTALDLLTAVDGHLVRVTADAAEAGGRLQHCEPALQQPVESRQQRWAAHVSGRRLRGQHLRFQQPGRTAGRRRDPRAAGSRGVGCHPKRFELVQGHMLAGARPAS